MKTFYEIKNELKEKNLTKKQITKKIFTFNIAKFFVGELFYFLVTTIPFVIGSALFGFDPTISMIYLFSHMIFYTFYLKKEYKKDLKPDFDEVKMIIQALKELKEEK